MRNIKPGRHTLITAQKSIDLKNLGHILKVISITDENVLLEDIDYGNYTIDIKALSPKTNIPPHKKRKHKQKLEIFEKKYVNQVVNGLKITEIFYGPDRGYKNRSFYLVCIGTCGHTSINSYATLTTHRKQFSCMSCSKVVHGERSKIEGKLKKRTSTYLFWQKVKDTLPEKYQEYSAFKHDAGDKPYKRADLIFENNKFTWVNLEILEDVELNCIATAIRQAFRNSYIYKEALELSKVETETGSGYRCNHCSLIFKRKQIEVDHIDPIQPLDGSPLSKDTVIDRIWTTNIQILDKKCHRKKSTVENKLRRENKVKKAKLIS